MAAAAEAWHMLADPDEVPAPGSPRHGSSVTEGAGLVTCSALTALSNDMLELADATAPVFPLLQVTL